MNGTGLLFNSVMIIKLNPHRTMNPMALALGRRDELRKIPRKIFVKNYGPLWTWLLVPAIALLAGLLLLSKVPGARPPPPGSDP